MSEEPNTGDLDKFLGIHESNVEKYLSMIEEMLDDPDTYDWAEDTLQDIWASIDEYGIVTKAQMKAIENIRNAGHRRRW